VAAGLNGHGEEFSQRDAGKDEQSTGCATAAEAFAEEEKRGEPGENGLEREDEGGMGSGEELLRPRLHGEGGGGGENGGDEQSDDDAGRPVDPGVLEERYGEGHEEGAEANLENGELFEGKAGREMGERQDVEGEAERAAEGEEVAEADGAEIESGAGRGGQQNDAGEGDEGSGPGVPAGSVRATGAKQRNGAKKGNEDDDHSCDERRLRRGGETESGSLELIAHGEAEADSGAGEESAAIHAPEVAAVEEREAGEGEGHADEIEEQRRDLSESILDDDEGATPNGDDGDEQNMGAQRTRGWRGGRHGGRVANRDKANGGGVIAVDNDERCARSPGSCNLATEGVFGARSTRRLRKIPGVC
jgi:hypothetical protein